jgi:hypothetical protein
MARICMCAGRRSRRRPGRRPGRSCRSRRGWTDGALALEGRASVFGALTG